jgi:hypothetical protein
MTQRDKTLKRLDDGLAAIDGMQSIIDHALAITSHVAPAPRPDPYVSPNIPPYPQVLNEVEEVSPDPNNGVDLSISDLADIPGQSSIPRLPPRFGRKKSYPMEFVRRQDIPRVLSRKKGPLDDSESELADSELSLMDVFGPKLMCEDFMPQPKKKGVPPVFDPRFVGYCPPFSRADIQAESSVRYHHDLFAPHSRLGLNSLKLDE